MSTFMSASAKRTSSRLGRPALDPTIKWTTAAAPAADSSAATRPGVEVAPSATRSDRTERDDRVAETPGRSDEVGRCRDEQCGGDAESGRRERRAGAGRLRRAPASPATLRSPPGPGAARGRRRRRSPGSCPVRPWPCRGVNAATEHHQGPQRRQIREDLPHARQAHRGERRGSGSPPSRSPVREWRRARRTRCRRTRP